MLAAAIAVCFGVGAGNAVAFGAEAQEVQLRWTALEQAGVPSSDLAPLREAFRRLESPRVRWTVTDEQLVVESGPDVRDFRWNGREADAEQCAHVRTTLLHSIGSCSFFEPLGELEALGIL